MTGEEKLNVVLRELRDLLQAADAAACPFLLIGGQVLAILAKSVHDSGELVVETATGVRVSRGYSFEPDLLLDVEEEDVSLPYIGALADVLRQCGFSRSNPETRWVKRVGEVEVLIDLFAAPSLPDEMRPTRMTTLPRASLASARATMTSVVLTDGDPLRIKVPDALGFLGLKTEAKLQHRPRESKDCFDAYSYVTLVGVQDVARSLARDGRDGPRVAAELRALFGSADAPGVRDVVQYSKTLGERDLSLLAQAVVDVFQEVETLRVKHVA
jgi:hypothetical protein